MRTISCDKCKSEIPQLLVGNEITFSVNAYHRPEASLLSARLDLCAPCRDEIVKDIAKLLGVKVNHQVLRRHSLNHESEQ